MKNKNSAKIKHQDNIPESNPFSKIKSSFSQLMGTSGLSHLRQKSIKTVAFETPRSVDLDLLNGNPRIWIRSSDFGGSDLLLTSQFITNRPKQKSPKFPI